MSRSLRDVPLSDLSVEDGARPEAPIFEGVSDGQKEGGRHLAAIHRYYLADLSRIAQVLRRIKAGDAPPQDLSRIILAADMTQNLRAFGTLCGQQCTVLTMHHNIEEQALFPELHHKGDTALRAVIDRLRAEHEVVHELLERLAASAHELVDDPSPEMFDATGEIFERLVAVVTSHFRYEETELRDALGVLDIRI